MIVVALKSEIQNCVIENFSVLITGMGLLPAYSTTFDALTRERPSYVINMGSAASVSQDVHIGEIVTPSSIHLHPLMSVSDQISKEGVDLENVPVPIQVPCLPSLAHYKKINLSSGDVFVTADNLNTLGEIDSIQAVDMEAYAVALACKMLNIPFYCIKYISDHVLNGTSESQWSDTLRQVSCALSNVAMSELK